MRDIEVIASELRLIAAVRRTAADLGAPMHVSSRPISCLTNGSAREVIHDSALSAAISFSGRARAAMLTWHQAIDSQEDHQARGTDRRREERRSRQL
jgi:hypothetical protein